MFFDNYIQISDVDRKDLGAYLFGDELQREIVFKPFLEHQYGRNHKFPELCDFGKQPSILLVCLLELDLDCLLVVPIILDGKQDLSQPLAPGAHISFKGRTVPQYLQNVTEFHVRGLHSDLKDRLRALQTKSI